MYTQNKENMPQEKKMMEDLFINLRNIKENQKLLEEEIRKIRTQNRRHYGSLNTPTNEIWP